MGINLKTRRFLVLIKQHVWEVETQTKCIITLALNENGRLHVSALFSTAGQQTENWESKSGKDLQMTTVSESLNCGSNDGSNVTR